MTNSKCSPDPNRVESESVSNKCEVVYIKEKNLDDYISKTAKLEGEINIINNRDT